jgi:hypothetical protein
MEAGLSRALTRGTVHGLVQIRGVILMRYLFAAATALAFSSMASAEPEAAPAAAEAPAYAVPVEALSLGKAKGKWTESVFSAGAYVFASETQVIDKSGPFSIDVMGSTRAKKTVNVKYRFTRADNEPRAAGLCSITTKTWSGLWNTADNTLYTCTFKDMPTERFALEAVVPDLTAESTSMLSFANADEEKFKTMQARLLYDGVLYEAVPTGLEPDNEFSQQRVAKGYSISEGGRTIGRIDFPDLKGKMVFGDPDKKSIITAPVAEADGREAVIFFASHLLRLPEANSPALKAE